MEEAGEKGEEMGVQEEAPSSEEEEQNGEPQEKTVSFNTTSSENAPARRSYTDNRSQRPGFGQVKHRKTFLKSIADMDQEEIENYCCPNGTFTKQSIPLILGLIAFAFTAAGMFSCKYFEGASTAFSGDNYGLWSVEDLNGNCQLWDVLFGSIELDPYLKAARALSMMGLVLGLSLLTAMSQALRCHCVSIIIFVAFLILTIVSLSIHAEARLWALFMLLLYINLVLIVRFSFIHPVHRAISKRGSRYIAWLLLLTFLLEILTLLVLNSDYCQCSDLESLYLANNKQAPNYDKVCRERCKLGPAAILMILGSAGWFFAGITTFIYGVQPEDFETIEKPDVAGYCEHSITTQAVKAYQGVKDKTKNMVGISEKGDDNNDDDNINIEDGNDYEGSNNRPPGLDEVLEEDDDDNFHRSRCQKCCFDYRVSKRSTTEKIIYWSFRTILFLAFALFILIVLFMIGAKYENDRAARAPSTSPNFITNITCAFNATNLLDANGNSVPWKTYDTPEQARMDNMTIGHCGACGNISGGCSNFWDAQIYVKTLKTIGQDIKKKCKLKCGLPAPFGSNEKCRSCLNGIAGFTDNCTSAWMINIFSTKEYCKWICFKTILTGLSGENNLAFSYKSMTLNPCVYCDEKMSGDEFTKNAGLARRRMGIQSGFSRNPDEICKHVDFDWATYEFPAGIHQGEQSET